MHNLLGARKFAELRHDIQAERLSFPNLFQPPEGLKRDYDKHKKARKQKIDALLRKLGADRTKIYGIVRAADAKVEAVLSPDNRNVAQGLASQMLCVYPASAQNRRC